MLSTTLGDAVLWRTRGSQRCSPLGGCDRQEVWKEPLIFLVLIWVGILSDGTGAPPLAFSSSL